MSDLRKQLIEEAADGAEARAFLSTPIGKYMVKKAEQDEYESLRRLADCDLNNKDESFRLQVEAKAPRMFIKWLQTAIVSGDNAKSRLEAIERNKKQGDY